MRAKILRSFVFGAVLLIGAAALASERTEVELCGNGFDDDGDGLTDEQPCQAGPSAPVSGDGILPELWYGGPDCTDSGYGDLFGFRIDATPSDGAYSFTSEYGILDGGPEDPANGVEISNTTWIGDNIVAFDWTATLPVEAIIVKSQGTNVYVYESADFTDSWLGSPGLEYQVAHVELCYSYSLVLSTLVQPSFHRMYSWTIDKSASPTEPSGFLGESAGTTYQVSVDRSAMDFGFTVSGAIQVYNPTAVTVGFSVTDALAGGYTATVACPETTIEPHETVTCTYWVTVPDGTTRLSTATVTTDNPEVRGTSAEALAVFGAEPSVVVGYSEVIVTDSQPVATDPWAASGDATWTYPATFDCPADPDLYTMGLYTFQVENTARIVETEQADTVTVTVSCSIPWWHLFEDGFEDGDACRWSASVGGPGCP